MIGNYFRLAVRNLIKHKVFTFINIVGLSAGMTATFLIFEFVNFELSYDHFNKNAERIYRVCNDRYQNGKLIQHGVSTYSGISVAMKGDFAEISDYTRIRPGSRVVVGYNGKSVDDQRQLVVENSFLTMFSYPLEVGDEKTALMAPYEIVLTESLAKKIFNVSKDNLASVLGKSLSLGQNPTPFKITGICEDVPENSHLQFDFLTSYITLYKGKDVFLNAEYDFTDSHYWHYIMLKPGVNYKLLETKFADFSARHFQGNKMSGSIEKFYLQPLLKTHLHSDFDYEIADTFSATTVWGLFIVAIFVLAIACTNYINLSIAKSMDRSKEVALRKLLGASRIQLSAQLVVESLIINVLSVLIALTTVGFAQSYFNKLINHNLSLTYFVSASAGSDTLALLLLVLFLTGTFFSGLYPGFLISSSNFSLVLRGKRIGTMKGVFLRKALIVGQFVVTIVLVNGSILTYQQMRFVSEQDLGFNMSELLVISAPILSKWDSTLLPKQNAFVSEMKRIPGVTGAAFSWQVPGEELSRKYDIRLLDQPGIYHFTMSCNGVSPDFIRVYQTKMLAGRLFNIGDYRSIGIPNRNVILNRAAINLLGMKSPDDAIGRKISVGGGEYDVVGAVSDFHQQSLHYAIEPTIFYPATGLFDPFSIRVDYHNLRATIKSIKATYDVIFPGNLFKYYFLDEKFNRQYGDDMLFDKSFKIFSMLAILIACLGLLGLSLYTTVQRTREIGTRKVVGASVTSIVALLTISFMRLVLIAIFIATPISWYIMHKWLQNFASRIDISLWVFIASALLALVTACCTISIQTVKAALANPVNALRAE